MYVEARKRLVDWLRRQLIGPAGEGRLGMSPLDRYPTGVLHPVDPPVSGVDPASADGGESEQALLDEQEEAAPADGEADGRQAFAQPARRRRYVPPSSVGFSCFVRGEVRLSITCSAAMYREAGAGERDFEDRDEAGRFLPGEYTRTRLPERTVQWSSATARGESRVAIWEGQARAGVISSIAWPRSPPRCSPLRRRCSTRTRTGHAPRCVVDPGGLPRQSQGGRKQPHRRGRDDAAAWIRTQGRCFPAPKERATAGAVA